MSTSLNSLSVNKESGVMNGSILYSFAVVINSSHFAINDNATNKFGYKIILTSYDCVFYLLQGELKMKTFSIRENLLKFNLLFILLFLFIFR